MTDRFPINDDFDVLKLPPHYSDVEQDTLRFCSEKIWEAKAAYEQAIAPYQKTIIDISNRYAPRYILVPKEETNV